MLLPHNQVPKLIDIYFKINDLYRSQLCYKAQRFSNNNEPDFADHEIITIFLYQ